MCFGNKYESVVQLLNKENKEMERIHPVVDQPNPKKLTLGGMEC